MRNAMKHERNTSNNNNNNNDEDENDNFGNSRQHLPRRCKTIKPFYAIDLLYEEEPHHNNNNTTTTTTTIIPSIITKKKKGLLLLGGASSSTNEPQANDDDDLPLVPVPVPVPISAPTDPVIIIDDEKRKEIKEEQITTMNKSINNIPSTIISWMVEMKVVKKNSIVHCFHGTKRKVIGKGVIGEDGIVCFCCEMMFSVSNFSRHRGDYLAENPYENLLLEDSGVSLLTCQIEAWNNHSVAAKCGYLHVVKRVRLQDHHDDCCIICADGGDLMCCENCPSTYHSTCARFKGIPKDDWRCPYCHCKYCDNDNPGDLLLTCFQCLKKYHGQCSELIVDKKKQSLHPPRIPFCGKSCWMVYQNLERRLGRNIPLKHRISWKLVRRMELEGAEQHPEDLHMKANCNSMVVLAAMFMEQCFKAIYDRQTKINIAQSVVYSCGSNFTRINFSRFYTAILEFEGHIVSAASLRIPSPKLVEIPFIATNERWRCKGMCTLLLKAIESTLGEIGVEKIVIPSAEEMVLNWQKKFGFMALDEATKKEIIKLNTLMFPGTTRLQKIIKVPTPKPGRKRIMLRQDLNLSPVI